MRRPFRESSVEAPQKRRFSHASCLLCSFVRATTEEKRKELHSLVQVVGLVSKARRKRSEKVVLEDAFPRK